MDLASRQWSHAALGATAAGLRPAARHRRSVDAVGELAPYWRQALSAAARGFPGRGTTRAARGARPGSSGRRAALSGRATRSSRIVLPPQNADGTGHVFGSPAGGYMPLICFANGSLAREEVRGETGPTGLGTASRPRCAPPRRQWRRHHAAVVRSRDYAARTPARRTGASISTRTMARPTSGQSSRRR